MYWHTFQSNCSLKENDFCIWRPFSLLRQVMQVALTEKYSSIQFPFPHYYINIISSLHWHALITTLPLYFASSRNYKPRRRKYVLLAFSCFFLVFNVFQAGISLQLQQSSMSIHILDLLRKLMITKW